MKDKQDEACWLSVASSPSCFSLVNMKVVVQVEASLLANVFRFTRLISLSTRLLLCIFGRILQGCPSATWHADLTPKTRIDDIKLKFCQQNGLSPGSCVLSSKGVLLKDQPKVCHVNVEHTPLAEIYTVHESSTGMC